MSAVNRQFADAGVGLLSAVVTWVVFSATVSLLVVSDALARTLPVELSWGRGYAVESVGYLDVFWRTLSLWPFRLRGSPAGPWPTIEPVLETAPATVQLLMVAAGFAIFVVVPVVVLAQVVEARRTAAGLGLLTGVPTLSLVFFLVDVAPEGGRTVEAGDFGGLLLPALALAFPLGFGLARLVTLVTAGDPVRAARDLLLEGWLYVLWLPGALLVTEAFFRVRGSTSLLLYSFNTTNIPRLVQGTSLLVLPVLAAGLYRNVLLAFLRPDPDDGRSSDTAVADGGVASIRQPLVEAARESRVVHLAGTALAGLLVVGLVGTLSLSPAAEDSDSPPLAVILEGVWMATGTAVVVFVVATVVGLGLGVVGSRRAGWRHLPRLLDPVGHLPSFVLLLSVPMLFAPVGTHLVAPLFGTLAGLAVAPVVARRYLYGVRDADRRSPALAATGVASTGAGLATFTVAQLTVTVPGSTPLTYLPVAYKIQSLSIPLAVMFGLPAVAMFVLGEGLRRYEPTA